MAGGINHNSEYQSINTSNITALNDVADFTSGNQNTEGVIITGTWSGTIVFEYTIDQTNWFPLSVLDLGDRANKNSTSANGTFLLPSAGFTTTRARASAWTSGTATVVNFGSDAVAVNYSQQGGRWAVKSNDGLSAGGIEGNVLLATANTAYEAKVGLNRLPNRTLLTIFAVDSDIYWGYNSTVTENTGTLLKRGQQINFDIISDSINFQVWVVADSNNKNIRVTESP